MHLILLAAGKGSRLPKKFRKNPKCMVKINKKTILEHNLNFYKKFKFRTIVGGYKSNQLKNFITQNNFFYVQNKEFNSTNMVYSLFKVTNIKAEKILICYSDIIFDPKIYLNLKDIKTNSIIVKKNWLKIWKGRMSYKKVLSDAEDLKIEKNNLVSIGKKIKKKLPKYQYMGIIKLKKIDFFKLKKFFRKLNNKKIDFTSFLDIALQKKIIKLKIFPTKKYWFEIDNSKDLDYTKKYIW